MGKTHECLTEEHIQWIAQQKMFFVASAACVGHVNVSPKGHARGTFAVLSPTKVAYLDFTGSGSETAAHAFAGGRITIMFVAFEGAPTILRVYGRAQIVHKANVDEGLKQHFAEEQFNHKGARAVVIVEADRVQSSCGFSIPLFDFVKERTVLHDAMGRKTQEEVQDYWVLKNSFSIDGIPSVGLRSNGNAAAPAIVAARQKGGFWHGFANPTAGEMLCSWLGLNGPVAATRVKRDLCMAGLGAATAFALMQLRGVQGRAVA